MKMLKEHVDGILLCLSEIVVGILLFINPVGFASGIIVMAGIVLLALGLIDVIKYFRADAKEAATGQYLTKGLLALLAGGFCAFKAQWFIATFPLLTILYGAAILIAGLGKVQMTVDMLRFKNKKWFWAAISAVISIIGAGIILKNPFTSTAVLWMFTGITLVVEAVFDVIAFVMSSTDTKA